MTLNYQTAAFLAAYGTVLQLPASTCPEISFVGRSNVGKSSLMNKLFARKNLVQVSSTPGKTSTINFFSVNDVHFVDLPGYGYAKVAKSEKGRWSELIEGYFTQARRFALVVSLIDIRHDATKDDIHMVNFLEERELPYLVAFTKADKLSRAQQQRQVSTLAKQLAGVGANPVVLATSSQSGQGVDDLRTLIEDAIQQLD